MNTIGNYYGVASCFYKDRINFCVLKTREIGQETKDEDLSWNEFFAPSSIDRLAGSFIEVMRLQNEANASKYIMPVVAGWTSGYHHSVFDQQFNQKYQGHDYLPDIPIQIMNLAYYLMQRGKDEHNINSGFDISHVVYFPEEKYADDEIDKKEIKKLEDWFRRAEAKDENALRILCFKARQEAIRECKKAKKRFGSAHSKARFINMTHPKSVNFALPSVREVIEDTIRKELGLGYFRFKLANDPRGDYFFDIAAPIMDEAIARAINS